MTTTYRSLIFSDAVKAAQTAQGSRQGYAREEGSAAMPDRLGQAEAAFIEARDSLYMATTGAGGWPYMQHRGGPPGFVKVISESAFAFADFRGNRQYISLGNMAEDNRAAFFFMDYMARRRLKLLGRVRAVELAEQPDLAARLALPGYKAAVERGLIVEVEAFDWNCPQHITPRYTLAEIAPTIETLKSRIAELEAKLAKSQTTVN